jgi:hypothetical protein
LGDWVIHRSGSRRSIETTPLGNGASPTPEQQLGH